MVSEGPEKIQPDPAPFTDGETEAKGCLAQATQKVEEIAETRMGVGGVAASSGRIVQWLRAPALN